MINVKANDINNRIERKPSQPWKRCVPRSLDLDSGGPGDIYPGRKSGTRGACLEGSLSTTLAWLHKENNRRRESESESESFSVAKCGPRRVPFGDPIARAAPLWTGDGANASDAEEAFSIIDRLFTVSRPESWPVSPSLRQSGNDIAIGHCARFQERKAPSQCHRHHLSSILVRDLH